MARTPFCFFLTNYQPRYFQLFLLSLKSVTKLFGNIQPELLGGCGGVRSMKCHNKEKSAWTKELTEQLAMFMWDQPGATEEECARHIGISCSTLRRYWKDKKFCTAVIAASEQLSAKARPRVDAALAQKAASGDVTAIRLFYQLFGGLSEHPGEVVENNMNVTVTIIRPHYNYDNND